MKSTDLIKELIAVGCVLKRIRGSHHLFGLQLPIKRFQYRIQNQIYRLGLLNLLENWQGFNRCLLGGGMFFSVGIETPKKAHDAYGIVVPALCNGNYGCYSAADLQSDIAVMAREAILLTIEDMLESKLYIIDDIIDHGYLAYNTLAEYQDFDSWCILDIDLACFSGKQHRINITLPDILIKRIDNKVKENNRLYRDRSHFIAEAAKRELSK